MKSKTIQNEFCQRIARGMKREERAEALATSSIAYARNGAGEKIPPARKVTFKQRWKISSPLWSFCL